MPDFRGDLAYEKHPRVAIRPEEFGGLAYHYDTRRLLFLKSRALVDVVESLGEFATADDALTACAGPDQASACAAALPRLLAANVIRIRSAPAEPGTVRQ